MCDCNENTPSVLIISSRHVLMFIIVLGRLHCCRQEEGMFYLLYSDVYGEAVASDKNLMGGDNCRVL